MTSFFPSAYNVITTKGKEPKMNTVSQNTIDWAEHNRFMLSEWNKSLTTCIRFEMWDEAKLAISKIEFYTDEIQKINADLMIDAQLNL